MLGKCAILGVMAAGFAGFTNTGMAALNSVVNTVKYTLTGAELNAIGAAMQRPISWRK